MNYYIIVNENMHDADAWIEWDDGDGLPTVGPWERVYSCHQTREEADIALSEAKDYARGKLLR